MKNYLLVTLCALGLSFLFCWALIPILRKWKMGQNILSYVKERKKKGGTPTMGGLAFILAAVLSSLLFIKEFNRVAAVTLTVGVAYMLVGFIDDLLKKRHGKNLGLKAYQKLLFQGSVAVFVGIFCIKSGLTFLNIPFTNKSVDIGNFAFILTVVVFVATVNAVNLTDGLDGLAAGACTPFFAVLGVLSVLLSGDKSCAIISFSLVGALLAYLIFNVSTASVFMGDTGSLGLGGFAACVAAFSGNALYLLIVGAVFVASVVSVILQVIYFKVTGGKRIFLMSPLHHHFQQKGYSESKIAYAYFLITLALGLICIVSII